jgi:pilus assembly protein FimV
LFRQSSQRRAHGWRQGFLYAFALVCLGLSSAVSALSFGRLTVQSNLGEPLKAEVEVRDLSPSDQGSLRLRLASPQAYRLSGLEFDALVADVRALVVRRPDGRHVIQLTTEKVVNNVFVDLMLEARWPAGQRMLGYTLLVSPKGVESATPITPAVATAEPGAAALVPSTAPGPAAAGTTHLVSPGETLLGVARQYKPEGVSLDQMLVALYRSNPQAFIGANMNRLKAGAVLTVPSTGLVEEVSQPQARELIQAHSADFGAYRERLAVAAPKATQDSLPARQASGRVETRVQDRKSDAAPAPDQLKLSQANVKAASSPEAAISRQVAAQDAAQREAELARNVQALRDLRQLGGVSAAASAIPAEAAAVASPSSAASVAAVAAVAAVASAASPAPPASAASAPMLAASGPAMLSLEGASALAVPAAVALVLLMASFGAYRLWRARRASSLATFMASRFEGDAQQTSSTPSELTESALGLTDGAQPSVPDSLALAELGATGEIDPIAEADVYLSYGRDAQAEEILRDALQQMPDRVDIRVKLLEVLALRRDLPSYVSQAQELYPMTDPAGAPWLHVASMGRAMDPDNPLFAIDSLGADDWDVGAQDDSLPPPEAAPLSTEEVALGPELAAVEADDFALELGSDQLSEAKSQVADDAGEVPKRAADRVLEVDLGDAEPAEMPPESRYMEEVSNLEHSLERKLALATEFMQIGDFEGARDLLDEVYSLASGALKDRARDLLEEMN